MEFVSRLPERPRSQQRHVLQAPKDVSVCGVLIHVQRIRGFTTMRYINPRFTYLLMNFDNLMMMMTTMEMDVPGCDIERGKRTETRPTTENSRSAL